MSYSRLIALLKKLKIGSIVIGLRGRKTELFFSVSILIVACCAESRRVPAAKNKEKYHHVRSSKHATPWICEKIFHEHTLCSLFWSTSLFKTTTRLPIRKIRINHQQNNRPWAKIMSKTWTSLKHLDYVGTDSKYTWSCISEQINHIPSLQMHSLYTTQTSMIKGVNQLQNLSKQAASALQSSFHVAW